MFPKHHSSFHARGKRSSAMIITLAAVLLVSAILLVFFDQSMLNRQISFSSAGQYRADTVAHTALDTVVGDLRNEIVSSSITYTSNGITLYAPTNQGTPLNQTVEPCQVLNQGSSTLFTNLVVQSTAGSNFWTTAYNTGTTPLPAPKRSAPGNSTSLASFNSHFIATSRWNKPGLLGDPGTGSTPQISGTYVPPDWVMVTRSGALDLNAGALPATTTLADKTAANTNFVVGRYAYTIYNEGGLLDANVAGCPQSVVGSDPNAKRGLLAQVNLADLLSNAAIGDGNAASDADALVKWRNQASAASPGAFTNYVYNSTNGFATVAPGDQAFLSRQDLIKYVVKNSNIPTKALPFLGTVTRELNAPSYTPPALSQVPPSPLIAGRSKTLSNEGYHAATIPPISPPPGASDDVFNPSLINTRVKISFTRYSDGTPAQAGESLIKYRFPLNRLAWIGYNGPGKKVDGTTAGASDILNAFGLTQTKGPEGGVTWTYNHGVANRIYTLGEVANLGREPDFFELLQAGMFVGSLGKDLNNTCTVSSSGANLTDPLDSNPYYQVIQTGANLIDQADADSYPTRIVFDAGNPALLPYEFDGIENLPCITRIWEAPYYHENTQPPGGAFGEWFIPEVWNPNISTVGIDPAHPGPTNFKFTTCGTPNKVGKIQTSFPFSDLPGAPSLSSVVTFPASNDASSLRGLNFSTSNYNFAIPALLTLAAPVKASADPSQGADPPNVANNSVGDYSSAHPAYGSTFIGISMGEVPIGANFDTKNIVFEPSGIGSAINPNFPITHQLWYQDANNKWVAYNRVRYVTGGLNDSGATGAQDPTKPSPPATISPLYSQNFSKLRMAVFWTNSDPRTNRFGIFGMTQVIFYLQNPSVNFSAYSIDPTRPGGGPGSGVWVGWPPSGNPPPVRPTPSGWNNPTVAGSESNTGVYPFSLSENKSFTVSHYNDPDGILRAGDGCDIDGNVSHGGYPMADPGTVPLNNIAQSRPVILNRPFRSVADMGYAFRDTPWKHVDFFTTQSADAALLDLFCVNESPKPPAPAVSSDPIAEVGRVALNTQQVPVLQAVLSGSIQWDDGNTKLSTTDAGKLASNLVQMTTGTGAHQGPLLNRSELVTRWISSTKLPALTVAPNTNVKRQREAAVRALADAGNTRTWNLLIDVIAQSGRYIATGGTDLNKQFLVEGERRYWLHVAIDRYTGKVIAQSLEPVYE